AQLAMQFMDEVESDHERYQDELTKVVASTGLALWGTDETFVYNWLQELPTTELQEAGAEAYLTSRGTSDPVKLSEWLAEWPDGSFRDRMAAYLAKLIPDSPEASLAWTATIDDVDQRRETFMNIIRYNNVGGMMEAIKGDLETFISEEDRAWLRQTQGLSW